MRVARGILLAALPVVAGLIAGASAQTVLEPTPGGTIRNDFDFDQIAAAPAFFDFVALAAPGRADWRVLVGANPPSTPNEVTQVVETRPADSIAVAVRRDALFQDGSWSLALEKGSGRGGIVFRLAGEKDFEALLVNLKTGEASLTQYRDGRPMELARGKARLENEWGILSITAKGPSISARFDGRPLLEASDPHPAAGRCGMATAGPGRVSFDEFILEPLASR